MNYDQELTKLSDMAMLFHKNTLIKKGIPIYI